MRVGNFVPVVDDGAYKEPDYNRQAMCVPATATSADVGTSGDGRCSVLGDESTISEKHCEHSGVGLFGLFRERVTGEIGERDLEAIEAVDRPIPGVVDEQHDNREIVVLKRNSRRAQHA